MKPPTRRQTNAGCVDGLLILLRYCRGGTGGVVDALYAEWDVTEPSTRKGDDSADSER